MNWTAQLWEIEDNRRAIPHYQIAVVSWTRKTEETPFWPAVKRKRYKEADPKKKKKAKPALGGGDEPPPIVDGSASSGTEPDDGPLGGGGGGEGGEDETEWWKEFKPLFDEIDDIFEPPAPDPVPVPLAAPVPHDPVAPPMDIGGVVVPPPFAKGKGRGRGGKHAGPKYLKIPVKGEGGAIIWHLLHNEAGARIDCHCCRHKDCAVGRTYIAWDPAAEPGKMTPMREARGRPLAFLIAWLRWGLRYEADENGRNAHMEASKCGPTDGANCLADGESHERQSARFWAEAQPSLDNFRDLERPRRPGEPLEPKGNV